MVVQEHGEFAYIGDGAVDGGVITLSADERHHLVKVRRAHDGDVIMATDGNGMVYKTALQHDGKLQILDALPEFGEPAIHLSLICGNLQGNTSRDVVSFAVQMGVRELWWVNMARSQENYSDNKIEKLQRVAIQATKQTGRARLLSIKTADSLKSALSEQRHSTLWFAHPESKLRRVTFDIPVRDSHCVIVGPEGGFAAHELDSVKQISNVFRLGNRRLRSETAVVAGLTFVLEQLAAL